MKKIFIALSIVLISCKNSNSRNYDYEDEITGPDYGYADGTYCAEIDYYYSETGTSSSYTLEVEIEDNELTVIHWPNGGWLDSSHFSPPDISDGQASFTSDANVEYTVRIIGDESECSIDSYARNEEDLLREKEKEDMEAENRRRQEEQEEEVEEERQQDEDERQRAEEEREVEERQREAEEEE